MFIKCSVGRISSIAIFKNRARIQLSEKGGNDILNDIYIEQKMPKN